MTLYRLPLCILHAPPPFRGRYLAAINTHHSCPTQAGHNPPWAQQVAFVDAFLMRCKQREGEPILAVEPFLHGKYTKHTNNYGFVSKEDRNTPQVKARM